MGYKSNEDPQKLLLDFISENRLLPAFVSVHRRGNSIPAPSMPDVIVGLFQTDQQVVHDIRLFPQTSETHKLIHTLKIFLAPPLQAQDCKLYNFIFMTGEGTRYNGCVGLVGENKPLLSRINGLDRLIRQISLKNTAMSPRTDEDSCSVTSDFALPARRVSCRHQDQRGIFAVSTNLSICSLREYVESHPLLSLEGSTDANLTTFYEYAKLRSSNIENNNLFIQADILHSISAQCIAEILCSLLLERSVILVSSTISGLIAVAECFSHCLHPLIWSHIYVPYLPDALLDIMQSPVPFLVGRLHNIDQDNPFTSDKCVVYNMEKDSIISSKDASQRYRYNVLSSHWTKVLRSAQLRRLSSNDQKLKDDDATHFMVDCCRDIIDTLLAGAHNYVVYCEEEDICLFDERQFIAFKKVEMEIDYTEFYNEFIRTQAFSNFISQRND